MNKEASIIINDWIRDHIKYSSEITIDQKMTGSYLPEYNLIPTQLYLNHNRFDYKFTIGVNKTLFLAWTEIKYGENGTENINFMNWEIIRFEDPDCFNKIKSSIKEWELKNINAGTTS